MNMKTRNKIGYSIYILCFFLMALMVQSCAKANEEFVHETNTISQMICKGSLSGGEYAGTIYEYNKKGELMTGSFTNEEINGGYGIIMLSIPESLRKDVDLTKVYLRATVTYDEMITPSLLGYHDISGDGIIITVKSGTGTTRQYRVRGVYE